MLPIACVMETIIDNIAMLGYIIYETIDSFMISMVVYESQENTVHCSASDIAWILSQM